MLNGLVDDRVEPIVGHHLQDVDHQPVSRHPHLPTPFGNRQSQGKAMGGRELEDGTVRSHIHCGTKLRELREYGERQGWPIVGVYQDVISGAKTSRPELNRLMLDAPARKFDCLLVWKLDRFGRSLVDCLNDIRDLERNGVRFIALTQGLDTDRKNPAPRFLLHVLGAAAEFERALISGTDASRPGSLQAGFRKRQGGRTVYSRSGRNLPPHRPRRVFDRDEVLRLRR